MRLSLKDMRTVIMGLKALEQGIFSTSSVPSSGITIDALQDGLINVPTYLRNGDDLGEQNNDGEKSVKEIQAEYIRKLRGMFEEVYEQIDSGVGFNVSFDSEGYVSSIS